MENTKINFRRLTEARYEHGLSVSELGILTGLTEMQISELENGEEGKAFVEHEHRIDCVKRVAEALGINYAQFLSSSEYFLPGPDISGLRKNEQKSDKEDLVNEFSELKHEITKFRINELRSSEYHEDKRIEEIKKVSGNLRSGESLGPIYWCFYIYFFTYNSFIMS